jgi:hypothetical protein
MYVAFFRVFDETGVYAISIAQVVRRAVLANTLPPLLQVSEQSG